MILFFLICFVLRNRKRGREEERLDFKRGERIDKWIDLFYLKNLIFFFLEFCFECELGVFWREKSKKSLFGKKEIFLWISCYNF